MEKESTIEEKIRMRRKEKSKRRAEAGRRMDKGQPAKKKRRKNETGSKEEEIGVEETAEDEQQETHAGESCKETPRKRKMEENGQRPQKKQRRNYDIKKWITCKRWKSNSDKEESNTMRSTKDKPGKEEITTTMEATKDKAETEEISNKITISEEDKESTTKYKKDKE